MSFDRKIESFIYLGKNKISISVFNEKNRPIFKKNLLIQKNYLDLDFNAHEFIEKTIFEFEKKNQIFLKQTNVIIDHDHFLEINISKKDKVNKPLITKQDIEYLIFDLKKIVQDNNYNYSITNIKIKNFRVDEKNYETFEQITSGGTLSLEVMFESLKKEILVEIKNFFSNLEIDINKYFSTNYLELGTFNEKVDVCAAAAKSLYNYDQNEVTIIPKMRKKKSFFEKLFYLIDKF